MHVHLYQDMPDPMDIAFDAEMDEKRTKFEIRNRWNDKKSYSSYKYLSELKKEDLLYKFKFENNLYKFKDTSFVQYYGLEI